MADSYLPTLARAATITGYDASPTASSSDVSSEADSP